ncbi:hypothetical protein OKW21_005661 [Catalinimonas alkaloidigena]|uniref:hypothetical protein n=1 Tax=Catalinimonas alkaloidigena TaxID=1075417 RepID=UPI00240692B5|nr:hypothetical protein [Catalinimonas alkaloidigena]MDF9800398.1 hypothetical protein [Catalinimonas alkaloidigena]
MKIDNALYDIREKLLELSHGDFVQEKKLADQYFKSFQDLKDIYAVSLINQDSRLLSFIHQKYKPTFRKLNLTELSDEIQSTIHKINNLNTDSALDESATKVRSYCETLIRQLQLHYSWLN